MPSNRKKNKYTAEFKLKVVQYAHLSNNCAAAREYGVSEKLVRDWKKLETKTVLRSRVLYVACTLYPVLSLNNIIIAGRRHNWVYVIILFYDIV